MKVPLAGSPKFICGLKGKEKPVLHMADDRKTTLCTLKLGKKWDFSPWMESDWYFVTCETCKTVVKRRTAQLWADAFAELEAC